MLLLVTGLCLSRGGTFLLNASKNCSAFCFGKLFSLWGGRSDKGVKNEQKKTAPCWIHPAFLNGSAAMWNIPMARFRRLLDRQEVCLNHAVDENMLGTLENPNHSQSQHILALLAKNAWCFFSGRELEGLSVLSSMHRNGSVYFFKL